LQPWVEDAVEQLAFGQLIHSSSNPSVRRLALIVIDNAVEVTLKGYVEFEKRIEFFSLKRQTWEDNYKSSLKKTLDLVVDRTRISVDKQLVLGFHETRNQLYHDPKLLSVEASDIAKYLQEAKSLVSQLYHFEPNEPNWPEVSTTLAASLFPRSEPPRSVTVVRRDDGSFRLNGLTGLSDPDAVAIVIQRASEERGTIPNLREVRETLRLSGRTPANLSESIRRLRERGLLQRSRLALTPAGQRAYAGYLS
jgi:hypothetical protein